MPKPEITIITRKPTHSERARYYEEYLFQINAARHLGNHDLMMKLLDGIGDWCVAHRDHNGTLSNQQVQRNVNRTFWKVFGKRYGL
jgi:hypothetical protein